MRGIVFGILAVVGLVVFTNSASVAQRTCHTVPYNNALKSKSKSRLSDEDFERWMSSKLQERKMQSKLVSQPYRIPVVVHVIHDSNDVPGNDSNISDAQVLSQIEVLNEDFNRLNSDAANTPAEFAAVAGLMDIEFILAAFDPNGEPTSGIVRVPVSTSSNNWDPDTEDEALKALSYWPAEDYLNIWVTRLAGNTLGYAQFPEGSTLPGLDPGTNPFTDGVVIHYRAFGKGFPNLFDDFNLGRTATHEVGHYLGLRHIWGDDNDCIGNEDYVDDTPVQSDETTGCPAHPQLSCGNNKMFQNYMDYTDDACYNLFTEGQVGRMITVLENSPRRTTLSSSPGLPALVASTDIAFRKIISPQFLTCSPTTDIVFEARNTGTKPIKNFRVTLSINGENLSGTVTLQDSINRNQIVTVTVSDISLTDGENNLTLEVDQPNQQPDNNESNGLFNWTILTDQNSIQIPFRENFTNNTAWKAFNPTDGDKWGNRSTNYQNSIYFEAFSNTVPEDESWLVGPSLNLSDLTSASFFFEYSYAPRPSGPYDRLRVLVTDNCGTTFTTLFDKEGTALKSSTQSSAVEFTPDATTEWTQQFINLSEFAGRDDVRIIFVATNGNGNNIYLDNFEFYLSNDASPVRPTDEYWVYRFEDGNFNTITFNLPELQRVEIEVIDLQGRLVSRVNLDNVLNQTYTLDLNDIHSGMYIIRVRTAEKLSTSKIILRK